MLSRDFNEFIESLNAHGVEYLVVGGYALAAHGHPRYTGDIDIWIGRDLANRTRLMAALLTGIDGVAFNACFARRQVVRVGALDLPIIHLEDFETNKRASGRLKDLADLEALDDDAAPE